MNAPDTSPRWDWSSWQIDATRRALRTPAREGTPGRGGVDPNRRCRKKGLYMLLYGPLGLRQVLDMLARIMPAYRDKHKKTLPQRKFGEGRPGSPRGDLPSRSGPGDLIPDRSRRRKDGMRAPGTGDSRMFYFIAASTARLAITVIRCAR